MATKSVFIRIKADTKQAQRETENLDDQTREAVETYRKLERQIDKMADNAVQDFKRMTGASSKAGKATKQAFDPGAMLGAVGLGSIAGSFIKDSVAMFGKMQKYETVLTTTLGTTKEAKAAMDQLRIAGAKTPYSVDELTGSFIKLANRGMAPSMKEMMLFGDVAASQGKSFDQFTEAVLDATSGEFERLKEFGIKGSKSGDQVALSFKGVLKEVKNTPEEIKKALLEFGEMEGVAGGMAAISQTLEGRLSNIGDTLDHLKFKTGEFINTALGPLLEYFTDGEKGAERVKVVLIGLAAFVLPALAAAGWAAISPFIPFIAIAAAIAAEVTMLYLIIEDIYQFTQGNGSMFEDFLGFLGFEKEDIEMIRSAMNAFLELIGPAWDFVVSWFKKNTILLFKALGLLVYPIRFLIKSVKEFMFLWNNLPSMISQAASSAGQAIIDFFVSAFDAVMGWINDFGMKIITALFPVDGMIRAFELIKPYVLELIDWVMNKLGPLKDVFASVKGLFSGDDNPVKIQARASGGPVEPGNPYLVGENGPEIRTFNSSGTILPNNVLNNSSSSKSTSNTISIGAIYVNGEADESLKDKIMDALNGVADEIAAGIGLTGAEA